MVRSAELQNAINQISAVIPQAHPATGWYYSEKKPTRCIVPDKKIWSCMFGFLSRLFSGEIICFSPDHPGCAGASCYLGYTSPPEDAGSFLAGKEKFKKNKELGDAFYAGLEVIPADHTYALWQQLVKIPDESQVEVVNLWIQADSLSGLVTLANYDRASNNNVMIPFSSGCQSIWTIPYSEKDNAEPKCVVGGMDPVVRSYLAAEVVTFSMVADRFLEMANNITGSFLESKRWQATLKKE